MKDDRLYLGHMPDRIVHDYFGVSLDIVWDVVVNHIPPLPDKLRRALGE